jgi:hypothetical protein
LVQEQAQRLILGAQSPRREQDGPEKKKPEETQNGTHNSK